jgi:hypothetical protein
MRKPLKALIIFGSGIILIAGCWAFPNYQEYVNSTIKPKRIRAIILGKSEESTGCYGLIIFKEDQKIDTLRKVYYCGPKETKVWNYIEPGDSIFKNEGTLEILVKRTGTFKKFVFADKIPM